MRLALLLALLLAQWTFAAEPRRGLRIGGEPFSGTLASAHDATLTFEAEGTPREVPAAELVSWGTPASARQGPQILLAGGGLLVADVLGSDEERLSLDSPLLGKVSVALEHIAGIVFHPPLDQKRADELLRRVLDHSEKHDLLLLDNGDELTGTIISISAKEVEWQAAVGKLSLETARILALAFDPSLLQSPRAKGLRQIVGFGDGTRLLATSFSASAGKAQLTLPGGQKQEAPLEQIVFLQTMGGQADYLSDLKPTGYKHVPFLELPWSYQLDRNVQGTPLRSGGRLWLKGVGMHSASRLTFPLDGRHKRFAAEAAIDDLAGPRGSVVFRIFVDAEQKFASPIVRGGDAPLAIAIDLPPQAKSLSLIVDFAQRGDELDYANWLNARLER
jgi:hypothetical protein